MNTLFLILLFEWNSFGVEEGLITREFCAYETMDIKCESDEVLAMDKAVNGRMMDGRCISREHGFIGCQKDVLDLVDLRCSGKRGCRIELPDKTLDLATLCPRDLMRFLMVTYSCMKVFTPSRGECIGNSFKAVPLPAGSLSSLTTIETSCGSTDIAWLIDASDGQTVTITLLDFGPKNISIRSKGFVGALGEMHIGETAAMGSPIFSPHCYVYGLVKQRRTGHTSKICGGLVRVNSSFRFSNTAVELRILPGHSERLRYFVINYEVTGCSDVDLLMVGTFIERIGNVTMVRCSASGSTWRLVCEGIQWRGEKPDCLSVGIESPNDDNDWRGEAGKDTVMIFSRATSLVTMTAIAAFIGILIFLVGLCCFARCRRRNLNHMTSFNANRYPSEDIQTQLKDSLQQYDINVPPPVLCPAAAVRGLHHQGPVPLLQRIDAENDYESMEDGSGGTTLVRHAIHAETCAHRAEDGLVQQRLSSFPKAVGPDVVVHRVHSQILPKNSYFGNAF